MKKTFANPSKIFSEPQKLLKLFNFFLSLQFSVSRKKTFSPPQELWTTTADRHSRFVDSVPSQVSAAEKRHRIYESQEILRNPMESEFDTKSAKYADIFPDLSVEFLRIRGSLWSFFPVTNLLIAQFPFEAFRGDRWSRDSDDKPGYNFNWVSNISRICTENLTNRPRPLLPTIDFDRVISDIVNDFKRWNSYWRFAWVMVVATHIFLFTLSVENKKKEGNVVVKKTPLHLT